MQEELTEISVGTDIFSAQILHARLLDLGLKVELVSFDDSAGFNATTPHRLLVRTVDVERIEAILWHERTAGPGDALTSYDMLVEGEGIVSLGARCERESNS